MVFLFNNGGMAQQYHELGGYDFTASELRYSQISQELYLSAFSLDLGGNNSDSAITYHHLKFDKSLNIISNKTFTYTKFPGFITSIVNGFEQLKNDHNHTFTTYFNPSKRGSFPLAVLGKIYYCKNSSNFLTPCISLLPDSAYIGQDSESFEFSLANNDTIYKIIEYGLGSKDSIVKQYLIKLDTVTGHVLNQELQLTHQGENIDLALNAVQLNSGNLLFTAVQYSITQFKGVVVELDLSFKNVIKVRPKYSSYKARGMWQKDHKLILFGRGQRYDPTVLSNFVYESIIEVIDLSKDTLSERYFFPSNPKSLSPSSKEFSGPGAYFNGEYFVLAETVNQDSTGSKNYKTTLFAVDTNFRVISSKTITNSNKLYYGRVSSFIPDPDTPHTYIYCGDAENFPITNSWDIMLGRFKVNANGINMPEVHFRKAEVYFYPNPSSTHVNILIDSDEIKSYQLEFYNQKGQKVMETETDGQKTRVAHSLPAGVYTVVASNGLNREVLSLVVE